jgi:hypothetical protein
MSNALPPPPPPPPPPPAPEGDNSAQSGAPKLKLNKPVAPLAPVATEGMPVPPPPAPSAGAPIPPPPAPSATATIPAPIPTPFPASAPRPSPSPANRNVGKFAAAVDLLALAASLGAVVILALELFSKSKG